MIQEVHTVVVVAVVAARRDGDRSSTSVLEVVRTQLDIRFCHGLPVISVNRQRNGLSGIAAIIQDDGHSLIGWNDLINGVAVIVQRYLCHTAARPCSANRFAVCIHKVGSGIAPGKGLTIGIGGFIVGEVDGVHIHRLIRLHIKHPRRRIPSSRVFAVLLTLFKCNGDCFLTAVAEHDLLCPIGWCDTINRFVSIDDLVRQMNTRKSRIGRYRLTTTIGEICVDISPNVRRRIGTIVLEVDVVRIGFWCIVHLRYVFQCAVVTALIDGIDEGRLVLFVHNILRCCIGGVILARRCRVTIGTSTRAAFSATAGAFAIITVGVIINRDNFFYCVIEHNRILRCATCSGGRSIGIYHRLRYRKVKLVGITDSCAKHVYCGGRRDRRCLLCETGNHLCPFALFGIGTVVGEVDMPCCGSCLDITCCRVIGGDRQDVVLLFIVSCR